MSDDTGISLSYSGPTLNPETGEWSDVLPEETKEKDDLDHDIELYFNICTFLGGGLSWEDFRKTPRPVLVKMNEKISEKLEDLDNESSFPHFSMVWTLLAISRAFGGGKS